MMQVISSMGVVYSIPFPNLYQQAVDSFGAYIDIQLPRIMPIRCLYPMNTIHELILKTGLTLVVSWLFWLGAVSAYAYQRRLDGEQAQSNDDVEPAAQTQPSTDDSSVGGGSRTQGAAKWRRVGLGARVRGQAALGRMAAKRPRVIRNMPRTGIAKLWGDACTTVAFYLVYLVYPSISTSVFHFFVCDRMDGDGEDGVRFLHVDFAVDCDGGLWRSAAPYVATMVCVFPIGVPLGYILLIRQHYGTLDRLRRYEIQAKELVSVARLRKLRTADQRRSVAERESALRATMGDRVSSLSLTELEELEAAELERLYFDHKRLSKRLPVAVKILTAGYKYQYHWFEIFECVRKILIIGLPVGVSSGSSLQRFLGLQMCFGTWGAYTYFYPFHEPVDNVLATICQLNIFTTLLASYLLDETPNSTGVGVMLLCMLVLPWACALIVEF